MSTTLCVHVTKIMYSSDECHDYNSRRHQAKRQRASLLVSHDSRLDQESEPNVDTRKEPENMEKMNLEKKSKLARLRWAKQWHPRNYFVQVKKGSVWKIQLFG